jgi:photosynthetic reaction center cytochrome c subunit
MEQVYDPRVVAEQAPLNQVPVVAPARIGDGPKAGTIYKNVQVLGDLDVAAFTATMAAMTRWVAPEQGCSYCHAGSDFAGDTLYTKVVARRMLQMTRHVNADWKDHVGSTGVTCYTCHRGQNVPTEIWFKNAGEASALGPVGNHAGKNAPSSVTGYSSLPFDPFSSFFDSRNEIRVVATAALPGEDASSIKQTEWTYALMIHMSRSLGVNCTFCHNTRSFSDWDQSSPTRATAWYGIRLVRDLNNGYLDGLADTLPAPRHGPQGDGPKVDCATCHQGAYKPLYGASQIADFPGLVGPASKPATPSAELTSQVSPAAPSSVQ